MTATVDNAVADLQRANAELRQQLDERIAERDEALQRETATAEVLSVINASPGDLTPVFDAILEKSRRFCDAAHGDLWTYDGKVLHLAATHGEPGFAAWLQAQGTAPVWPGSPTERLLHGADHVQFENPVEDGLFDAAPQFLEQVQRAHIRSTLFVPMRRDNALVGVIIVYRREVRRFTDKQIALLQNFAAQAVIAMENARLITETREALDQQTATAEVLQVINASPGDLTPVFDAILERAMSRCEAALGFMTTYDGRRFTPCAMRGVPDALAAYFAKGMDQPRPGDAHWQLLQGTDLIHNLDQMDDEAYRSSSPLRRAVVDFGGTRTALVVALRKDRVLRGTLTLYRQEVRAFTGTQVALVQNFAAQAVIAMENARLLGELRQRTGDLETALEYQTATSDVLKVISRSTFDLRPVLQTLVETAVRLCEADFGHIDLPEDGFFRPAATFAFSPEFDAVLQHTSFSPGRGTTVGRVLLERRTVHVPDVTSDPDYIFQEAVAVGNVRSVLGVPLLYGEEIIGVLALGRERAEGFAERQIDLVQTFADQAVIAIENARLITETREALEQQTATADVLGVINSSPGDLAPVFDAMLEKAIALCEATFGTLWTYDGEHMHAAAVLGATPQYTEFLRAAPHPPSPVAHRPLLGGAPVVHLPDVSAHESYRSGSALPNALVDLGGVRTLLAVPLRKDGALLGVFSIYRSEVRPFTDKQIALLQNFAAQAVIAMENARLLEEIRQRQAELRVTFDNMADGVVMFDGGLRLAAWNRNFQELLDLPDAVLAKRPTYADYLRTLAERGEFGTGDVEAELGRRLEHTDEELRLERTRPDGRVIEVRRNAVPDGGFVLIYSDITERKRSEAEVRASRDAAETALRDLKAAQANLIQAEKMASLGQLTAGIAHEIKNPLNFVNNFASLSVELLDELKEVTEPAVAALGTDKRAEVDETIELLSGNLKKIAEHGKRADNIVKSMLEHSRGVSGERRKVDLNGLVEEALNLAYHGARAQNQDFNITLERDYAHGLKPIELAPQEITRVFLNLFGNGFYAANKRAQENGETSFRPVLSVATHDVGDAVEVKVRDNGTGIAPEIRDKLFQPFFTTKPTGEGTGLGLSISYDIVTQQHGGWHDHGGERARRVHRVHRPPVNSKPQQ